MTKRYMDFVPSKNADKKTAVASGAPRRTNVADRPVAIRSSNRTMTTSRPKVMMPEPTATPRTRMVRRSVASQRATQRVATQKAATQSTARRVTPTQGNMTVRQTVKSTNAQREYTVRNNVKLGEIEDLSPKFVKTDVPKRPLGESVGHKAVIQPAMKNEAKEAKSKKLIGRFRNKNSAKAMAKAEKKAAAKKEAFVAPNPTFINQDKVAKRPLSKNVYQKKIVATDEKADKGPVAIITKPEKESKVGLVVAIILTIILGAVAGTIAFLLLPK